MKSGNHESGNSIFYFLQLLNRLNTSKNIKDKLKKVNKDLIYRYKRNSKNKNNEEETKLLMKRHIVENSFCNLKKLKRLDYRYEKNFNYFCGFVKLGLIIIGFR